MDSPMVALKWLLIAMALLLALVLLVGQLGLLGGTLPNDLGVREGKLKPPSRTRNSVTSQAALYPDHPMRGYAEIAPLALKGDGFATLLKIRAIVETMDGAAVVRAELGYLYAQFTTTLMKFVDDTEFWFDSSVGVIQVRSSSRVGGGDLGVNRARIEAIRARLDAAP
jgi:uncharacterized protein (DUF1499 family)